MALTMIDPTSSWFEIAELPVITQLRRQIVNGKELLIADKIFDKTLGCISRLVNKTWLCRYPRCCYLIYDNGSEFKLRFKYQCKSYGIKHKPTKVENLWANAILECVHQVLGQMLCTLKLIWPNQLPPICQCFAWDYGMGNLLYLSYSTESLTRCSHFWMWHALQHSACCWLAQNWRMQGITNWS